MQGIYGIYNTVTGDQYVGSAKNFYARKKLHLLHLTQGKHHSIVLQRAWNKYNENTFKFLYLEKVENCEKLIEREQWWIDNSNSVYNICKTAGSSLGVKRSKESREKMRKAHLGEKHPEWRKQIRIAAQSGDKHWTRKKKFSKEAKKRMSEAQKQLFKNGYVHPRNKAILQYDKQNNFIKEWISVSEANRCYNSKNIINCLQGRSKTAVGYIWRYKT